MSPGSDDPVPRDAWLSEALRHAPDADAAPPPRVNDTVLRMGRAAVAVRALPAPPPAPSWPGRLGAAWAWLARPPVAAGFAGLMVATVVGLMWWDRPLDEAVPPREEPVAAQPAAPTATPPAVATVPATPPPAQPAAPARKAAPAAAAPAPAPAPAPTAPAPALQRDMAKSAPSGAAAPAAPTAGDAAAEAAPRARESAERREAAASSAIGTPGLSNLRFEIQRRPQSWTWQRDEGAPREVDDAVQAWIAQADREARPHWQPGASGSGPASTTLRFTREGVVRAVLRVGPSGLQLTRGGKTESATLPDGQAAALLAALDALGP